MNPAGGRFHPIRMTIRDERCGEMHLVGGFASDTAPRGRPRVLILGGGFAGIGAARKLKKADADVVLVDEHDYHTFQPLLYQVATALLEIPACGHPLRDLFHEQPNVASIESERNNDPQH